MYNELMALRIKVPQQSLERLCQRYHVRRLVLFGSALGEDFGPQSDVDVLVEFEPGCTPGLAFVHRMMFVSSLGDTGRSGDSFQMSIANRARFAGLARNLLKESGYEFREKEEFHP